MRPILLRLPYGIVPRSAAMFDSDLIGLLLGGTLAFGAFLLTVAIMWATCGSPPGSIRNSMPAMATRIVASIGVAVALCAVAGLIGAFFVVSGAEMGWWPSSLIRGRYILAVTMVVIEVACSIHMFRVRQAGRSVDCAELPRVLCPIACVIYYLAIVGPLMKLDYALT